MSFASATPGTSSIVDSFHRRLPAQLNLGFVALIVTIVVSAFTRGSAASSVPGRFARTAQQPEWSASR